MWKTFPCHDTVMILQNHRPAFNYIFNLQNPLNHYRFKGQQYLGVQILLQRTHNGGLLYNVGQTHIIIAIILYHNVHKYILHSPNLQINLLCPNDATWRHGSTSTLIQVMACCLMAPSHYLNQCWLIFSKVQWHAIESNLTRDSPPFNH